MRRPPIALLLAFVPFLAACGRTGREPASAPIAAAAREAASVVTRFEAAMRARDFATVCDSLLTNAERAQAGGSNCAQLMSMRARGIERPHIRIRGIALTRDGALVRVQTTAEGQAPTRDVIRLVRERGRLRIASLGG